MKKYWYRIFRKLKLEDIKMKFVNKFADYFPGKYCWTDCVGWAFDPDSFNPFKIGKSKGCDIESQNNEACYCGSWVKGQCFEKLSQTEQQKLRDEAHNPQNLT